MDEGGIAGLQTQMLVEEATTLPTTLLIQDDTFRDGGGGGEVGQNNNKRRGNAKNSGLFSWFTAPVGANGGVDSSVQEIALMSNNSTTKRMMAKRRGFAMKVLVFLAGPLADPPWMSCFVDRDTNTYKNPGIPRLWRWCTQDEKGRRAVKKWLGRVVSRLLVLSLLVALAVVAYRYTALVNEDKPDYIDMRRRLVRNALHHEVDGVPWKSYSAYERAWINSEATRFQLVDAADLALGFKTVEWHDGHARNVSFERLFRSMLSVAPDHSCICGAHLLVPLNVLAVGARDGRKILVSPMISIVSEKNSRVCFKDDLFPSQSHTRTSAVVEGEKASLPAPNPPNSNRGGGGLFQDHDGIHCETFPERVLVNYYHHDDGDDSGADPASSSSASSQIPAQQQQQEGNGEGSDINTRKSSRMAESSATVGNRRVWFSSTEASCIVHCLGIATRSELVDESGHFILEYHMEFYKRN